MRSPFPGMDPYLEHPALWPDVHNRLIAAIADAITPLVAPRYYVGLERRMYLLSLDDLVFVGWPDVAVLAGAARVAEPHAPAYEVTSGSAPNPLWVELPTQDEVGDNYLEIRLADGGKVITVLELLSPANKLHERSRELYINKRNALFASRTNLVEIDLMRAGEPMPLRGKPVRSDYRILVSRSWQRPRAQLYHFRLREPIPAITIPLQRGEDEPALDLNAVLHDLYARARYDLMLDYNQPPVPPLNEADAVWARERIATTRA
ncbi:MAG: DUF4058 family protein [Anaerolineae bacterium]|nr:DUF4058 family protein [Candidatus Roseilinea sp.]MDW8449745.1 DUF4058 family protein [Anaerolineae bacterium]